jgi:hypothetical protein
LYKDIKLYNNVTHRTGEVVAVVKHAAVKHAARKASSSEGNPRRNAVLKTAKDAGLFAGETSRIAGRIRRPLIEAARARSGIKSDTALLEYALACVALEDDFGKKLLALKGTVPEDIDLEF